MSAMFVILCLADSTMRADLHKLFASFRHHDHPLLLVLMLIPFIAGLGYSVFHAFSKREKLMWEKSLMLLFAVLVSISTGLYAAMQMVETSRGWMIVFPIWNIIYAGLLLIMYRRGLINETCISDRNAAPAQVILTLFAVVVIFICCRY